MIYCKSQTLSSKEATLCVVLHCSFLGSFQSIAFCLFVSNRALMHEVTNLLLPRDDRYFRVL